MRPIIVIVAMFLLSLPAQVHADPIPKKYQPMIAKGLKWLVAQQHNDGHWNDERTRYPITMTSLAGLALLMEGSTPTKGRYAAPLRRAVDWLLKKQDKQGCFRDAGKASTRYMFDHAYAMLFLASVHENETDVRRRRRLMKALNLAVKFSTTAQTANGGWYYVSAQESSNADEACISFVQLHALLAARNAGIAVPGKVRKKASEYAALVTGPKGGIRYSSRQPSERAPITTIALACGCQPWGGNKNLIRQWWQYVKTSMPLERYGYHNVSRFYFAQAVYQFDSRAWRKFFPPAQQLTWVGYRGTLFAALQRQQQNDGHWSGGFGSGPVYTTSVNLCVLQLDNETLSFLRP